MTLEDSNLPIFLDMPEEAGTAYTHFCRSLRFVTAFPIFGLSSFASVPPDLNLRGLGRGLDRFQNEPRRVTFDGAKFRFGFDSTRALEGSVNFFNFYRPVAQRTALDSYGHGTRLVLDFFVNARREFQPLASVVFDEAGVPVPETVRIGRDLNLHLALEAPIGFVEGDTVSVEFIPDNHGGWDYQKYLVNTFQGHWELYRASGVNVPLILCLSAKRVSVDVLRMVSSEYINVTSQPTYSFDMEAVFFDLDETLRAQGLPIPEMLTVLQRIYSSGSKIWLVTRYHGDLASALLEIGLNAELFQELIHVRPGESKAKYVPKDAVFIDNEFHQRREVREGSGSSVLDLDQIDFLKLG